MAGRKRYVAVGNKWVEVAQDYAQEPKNGDSYLWNDREYQDMNDPRFSSRTEHREYMAKNGLVTIDDFREEFKTREYQRMEAKKCLDPNRKVQIARAIEKLSNGG